MTYGKPICTFGGNFMAYRAVVLPVGLFTDTTAPRVLASWRRQAVVESPSHLRRRSREGRLTLLCALLVERERHGLAPGGEIGWIRTEAPPTVTGSITPTRSGSCV